jgi:hypothetical protein
VRVVIHLDTDPAGRPVGVLCAETAPQERFSDWLDLLRVLEGCIQRARHTTHSDHSEGAPCEPN